MYNNIKSCDKRFPAVTHLTTVGFFSVRLRLYENDLDTIDREGNTMDKKKPSGSDSTG